MLIDQKAAAGKNKQPKQGKGATGKKHSASLPSQGSGFTGFTHSQAPPAASNYRKITSKGFE